MKIEDRLEALERVVQSLHAKMGHKWYIDRPRWKACACGAEEFTAEDQVPSKWELDEEF